VSASLAIQAALRGFEPSDEQWEAIRAPLEPIAIVAGAGSGKTAVMTARIVHLVETEQVSPSGVLGLTFTNKAAGELEERLAASLARIVPRPAEHPEVFTYHAFAQRIFDQHAPRIGIDAQGGLLTKAQQWQMLLGLMVDLPKFDTLEIRHPLSFIPQTLQLADQCANHLVTPEDLARECETQLPFLTDEYAIAATAKRIDLAKIVRAYIDCKRRTRRIDYGDQIALAVKILERFPDVVAELRERSPVVLLDEYQDTNPAQKVMLQNICPPGSAVTAVGDARQAIYAWRGASMYNLIHFSREFPRADGSPCRELSLSENFRSGSRIVALANAVIEPVPAERRPGSALAASPDNGDGAVHAGVFTDQEAEASFIADTINALHASGTAFRDIAVLIRTRRYVDPVLDALDAADIPFEMPEVGGLLKVPAVVDVVAWLRVLSDRGPETNRWLARILMGPRFRVHYRDLAPIARWAAAQNRELSEELGGDADPGEVAFSLADALPHAHEAEGVSAEALARIAEFWSMLDALRPYASQPLLGLVQTIAERTGIEDTLRSSPSRSAPAMRANLHGFFNFCAEFAPLDGEPTLEAFLDFLDAADESQDAIPLTAIAGSDSVKVMTVHGAKGLEFEVVFLPILAAQPEQGGYARNGARKGSVFPDLRTSDPLSSTTQLPPGVRKDAVWLPKFKGNKAAYRKELRERTQEDERRLFYVAVTRARKRLYCSAAHWYGADERKGPSEFLEEVLAHADVEVARHDQPPAENPLVERMRRHLRWPPVKARLDDDVLRWMDSPVEADPALVERHLRLIESLSGEAAAVAARPPSISATDAVRVALGKRSMDDVVAPLPEPATEARRLGIEVHAWIEERSRGLIGLAEEDALTAPSPSPAPDKVAAFKASYERLFGARTLARMDTGEAMVEVPFTLKLGERLVRGRIDAVYVRDDAGLEIVDFKTGAEGEDPGQLELYAEALAALRYANGPVTLTYAYLATGRTDSWTYTPAGLDALAGRLERVLT
jgi:DNA helicase-2/ATP-dependent DNA helicase PcrA